MNDNKSNNINESNLEKSEKVLGHIFFWFVLGSLIFSVIDSFLAVNSGETFEVIKGLIPLTLIGITYGKDIFYKRSFIAIMALFALLFAISVLVVTPFIFENSISKGEKMIPLLALVAWVSMFCVLSYSSRKAMGDDEKLRSRIEGALQMESILSNADKRVQDKIRNILKRIP